MNWQQCSIRPILKMWSTEMADYQPSLCIITPTIGRPTLARTLASAQIGPGDEWIVIGDGPQPEARKMARQAWGWRFYESVELKYLDYHKPLGNYGNPLRDAAMQLSDKDYFIFLDDDDILAPNAMRIIKKELKQHYPKPIMFRMINANGRTIWREPIVTVGNVGGSMFCPRNDPDHLVKWADDDTYQSDFLFIEGCLKTYGENWRQALVWSGDAIIICKPGNNGWPNT